MNPDFCYETAKLGQVLCSGVCEVTADEVQRFRSMLGYPSTGDIRLAPSSMGLTYGLRLGWEHSIFPPGVVRMGDDDVFGVPARVGDRLTTTFPSSRNLRKKAGASCATRCERSIRTASWSAPSVLWG